MLIQITNTCRMSCPHCMDNSGLSPQHMTMETARLAHKFAKEAGAHVILISGGEPTEHPEWESIVNLFLDFHLVAILSNGMWIDDEEKTKTMRKFLESGKVVCQITSIPGIYPTLVDIARLKALPNLEIHQGEINMIALGRAATDPHWSEVASKSAGTMSCFSSALVSAQLPFKQAIQNMEMRVKLCKPLIDWQGNLHWSESWLCPSFGHVSEDFDTLARKAHEWRPCCKCADYKKLKNNNSSQYIVAKQILFGD